MYLKRCQFFNFQERFHILVKKHDALNMMLLNISINKEKELLSRNNGKCVDPFGLAYGREMD